MIQLTVERFRRFVRMANTWVLARKEHMGHVASQLPQVPKGNIVSEPFISKQTALSIVTAVFRIARQDPNAVAIVAPSDHFIEGAKVFIKQISAAVAVAEKREAIVTFGIEPTWPSPEYGYIERAGELSDAKEVYHTSRFVEKPPERVARRYLRQGTYLWNSGIYIFSVKVFLKLLATYQPAMYSVLEKIMGASSGNTPLHEARIRRALSTLEDVP